MGQEHNRHKEDGDRRTEGRANIESERRKSIKGSHEKIKVTQPTQNDRGNIGLAVTKSSKQKKRKRKTVIVTQQNAVVTGPLINRLGCFSASVKAVPTPHLPGR